MPDQIAVQLNSRLTNLMIGIGAGVVFAVSVTNSIAYARNVSSSNNNANNSSGVSTTCASIMLSINIILAIISFFVMLYFFYRVFTDSDSREQHFQIARNYYRAGVKKLTDKDE